MNEKEGREWERGRRKIWYKRRGKVKEDRPRDRKHTGEGREGGKGGRIKVGKNEKGGFK